MRKDKIDETKLQEDQKLCLQCKQTKLLIAFSCLKGSVAGRKKICCECEELNRQERHRRVALYREMTGPECQRSREERKQKVWETRIILRQKQEERWREREHWYGQQADRRCRTCCQILPATAFGGTSSPAGFMLHTRCRDCHTALLERRFLPCCLCQRKTPRIDFLACFDDYALHDNGVSVSLCCKGCEAALYGLSEQRQGMLICSCCQRAFPAGQVIYAEVDPETSEVRYIGRTGKPQRRHAQHLRDASTVAGQRGTEKIAWFTRSNWIQTLAGKGLEPIMKVLQPVELSPLVVEWEQRYIWHGIQQGWKLLNVEVTNEALVACIRASAFDFLTAPFELLVQQGFFAPRGLPAFFQAWYRSEFLLT